MPLSVRILATIATLALPAALFLAPTPPSRAAEPVTVANFPRVQEIAGTVAIRDSARVTGRTDATRFLAYENREVSPLVGTTSPRDFQYLGTIEADGFASVILSVAAWLPSGIGDRGEIGVLLLPDIAVARDALDRDGTAPLALKLQVPIARTSAGTTVAATSERLLLSFPRWRAYLYNTTTSTLRVNAFAMLGD